jgi:hypothetical protein
MDHRPGDRRPSPDIVLDAMKASGWDEAVALDALETTMRSHLGLADGDASPSSVARPRRSRRGRCRER